MTLFIAIFASLQWSGTKFAHVSELRLYWDWKGESEPQETFQSRLTGAGESLEAGGERERFFEMSGLGAYLCHRALQQEQVSALEMLKDL